SLKPGDRNWDAGFSDKAPHIPLAVRVSEGPNQPSYLVDLSTGQIYYQQFQKNWPPLTNATLGNQQLKNMLKKLNSQIARQRQGDMAQQVASNVIIAFSNAQINAFKPKTKTKDLKAGQTTIKSIVQTDHFVVKTQSKTYSLNFTNNKIYEYGNNVWHEKQIRLHPNFTAAVQAKFAYFNPQEKKPGEKNEEKKPATGQTGTEGKGPIAPARQVVGTTLIQHGTIQNTKIEYELRQGSIVGAFQDNQGNGNFQSGYAIVNASNTAINVGSGMIGVTAAIRDTFGQPFINTCHNLPPKKNTESYGTQTGRLFDGESLTTNLRGLNIPTVNNNNFYVIHSTASGGKIKEAYQSAMKEVEQHKITHVAFPALGAGVYASGPQSFNIGTVTVANYIQKNHLNPPNLQRVIFVGLDSTAIDKWKKALQTANIYKPAK
ncbi:macro domain-containing protein, partial [Candidatus Dependentiae bacterium]